MKSAVMRFAVIFDGSVFAEAYGSVGATVSWADVSNGQRHHVALNPLPEGRVNRMKIEKVYFYRQVGF